MLVQQGSTILARNVDARFLYFRVLGCINLSMLLRDAKKGFLEFVTSYYYHNTTEFLKNGTNRNFDERAKAQTSFI